MSVSRPEGAWPDGFTVAEMDAAVAQGWYIGLPNLMSPVRAFPVRTLRPGEDWKDVDRTMRPAVARGEPHAIKAWMYVLAHSPEGAAEWGMAEWELPA